MALEWKRLVATTAAVALGGCAEEESSRSTASSGIEGVVGPVFALRASAGRISTADGNSLLAWGYGNAGGPMQYPGPTLILDQGQMVTVRLTNDLGVPVSIVFPGQPGVVANGAPGLLTAEAPPGGAASYQFVASRPGTYLYHSGTRPDVQVGMGLVGAIIVRPAAVRRAYEHPGTAYDREVLMLLTEMDPRLNDLVEAGRMDEADTSDHFPVYWFINGRNSPDTMAEPFAPWLPSQPYNCVPRMHPGERLLLRIIGGGRDLHPFHHHGNNSRLIARDGRLLESAPGNGPDLATSDFTIKVVPGETYDAIWEWTGRALGWDVYGHAPGDALAANEYAPDHGKPLPVTLAGVQELTHGEGYSGSPFLGAFGTLPRSHVSMNANAGYFHMFHSHSEKEITNNDIFPGGMMTMVIIEPPGVPIN